MKTSANENNSLRGYISAKKIIKESLPILFLSLLGSLCAGIILGGMEETLELVPGLIVVIPAMLDMRGNIYGALGSRLSTGLHQGLIEPRYNKNQNLINAITTSIINSVAISVILAIFAYLILKMLNRDIVSLIELTTITLIAGFLSGLILVFIVTSSVFLSYKKGLDPDNVIGPVVTVSGDIFSILILFITAKLVMGGI